jgi:hypothetical protein
VRKRTPRLAPVAGIALTTCWASKDSAILVRASMNLRLIIRSTKFCTVMSREERTLRQTCVTEKSRVASDEVKQMVRPARGCERGRADAKERSPDESTTRTPQVTD